MYRAIQVLNRKQIVQRRKLPKAVLYLYLNVTIPHNLPLVAFGLYTNDPPPIDKFPLSWWIVFRCRLAMMEFRDVNEGRPRSLLRILQQRNLDPEFLRDALAVFSHQLENYLDWWESTVALDETQRLRTFYIKARQELIERTVNFLESFDRLSLIHITSEQIPKLAQEVKYWEHPDDETSLLLALKNATSAMQEQLEWELQALNTNNWHLLDTVFGAQSLEKMALGYGVNPLKVPAKYLLKDIDTQGMTNSNVVETLWSLLVRHRKNEHFYKETLLSNLLPLNPDKTTALTEVPVLGVDTRRSWFDLALFGDQATVYEIKSELDSPERLKQQLPDYRSVFKNVVVVASPRNCRRMLKHLMNIDPLAGLLVLGTDGDMELMRAPTPDGSRLRKESILRFLRKNELERLLISKYGLISEASRSLYYKMLKEMASDLDVQELQALAMEQIRFRGLAGNEAFKRAPIGLKSTAYFLRLEKRKLRAFLKFLNDPFEQ
ncbi:MAG: sce7726 family protein [Burkholderiales bacterium]|nr:sce7726 family protein [Burkholderiales bacterium]